MPDYDPKSIPILDDVIEKVKIETVESAETVTESIEVADDNFRDTYNESLSADLGEDLSEDTRENIRENNDEEDNKSRLFTPDYLKKESAEVTESALIDYENDVDTASNDFSVSNASVEAITSPAEAPARVNPISIQEIADEIVAKLMPDLEIHLRTLVQQTLAEKLPEEIIKTGQSYKPDDD